MSQMTGPEDQSPFIRTLHGGAGIPGSEVVSDRSGAIYKLGPRLGSSGDVFELDDARFSEPTVIKLFPRAAGIDAQAVDAFVRSSTAASALDHPRIVRTLDAGVLENGTPFLVTERLTGETLQELFAKGVTLSTVDGLATLRAVGSALEAAHAAGLVHGEVRPDNIFIGHSSRRDESGGRAQPAVVTLLDFGVSYLAAPFRPTASTAGADDNASEEEQSFLSPEQRLGQVVPDDLDGRSDEYALAALARRLLAPNQSRRSPALTAVLAMAMNEKPSGRFDSVELFLTALQEVVGGLTAVADGRREGRKPLPDLDLTPIGSLTPAPEAASQLPSESRRNAGSGYASLTRQFFEDGNRLSEEAAAAALATSESTLSDVQIPTRRGGRALATVGALAAVGVIVTAWAGMWNPLLTLSDRARDLFANNGQRNARQAPVSPAPASPTPAPPPPSPAAIAEAVPVAASAGTPAPVARTAAAPASAPAAAAPVGAPIAGAQPAPPAGKVVAPEAREDDAAAGLAKLPASRAVKIDDQKATALGTATAHPARSATAARLSTPAREPLRGYAWSPSERRLVPANRASGALWLPRPSALAPAQWVVPSGTASSLPIDVHTSPPPAPPPPVQTAAPIIDDDDSAATAPAPEPARSTR